MTQVVQGLALVTFQPWPELLMLQSEMLQANPQEWQATSAGNTVRCHSDAVNAVTLSNLTQTEANQLWEVRPVHEGELGYGLHSSASTSGCLGLRH